MGGTMKPPVAKIRLAPEVRARVKLLPNGPPVAYPVQFRVVGPDPIQLRERADEVKVAHTWSLLSESERSDNWRISGVQHTAAHADSGRLYVLMHQGEPKTFQEPGTHVWVYDVHSGKRVQTIKLKELGLSIGVSQGAQPRLYSLDFVVPMPYLATAWVYLNEGNDGILRRLQQALNIYDGDSGEHLRTVNGLPYGYLNMVLPW